MPTTRLLRSAAFAGLLAGLLVAPTANAQRSGPVDLRQPPWTLTGSLEMLRVGPESWGSGPAFGIRRDFGPTWGVELRTALPAFGSTGGGGAAIDLAATYTSIKGATELGGALGATGFLVGDDSELTDGGIGLYLAAHATSWLTHAFGLTVGANLRTASGAYPGVYGGMAVRF
jgi:hypothetical protein